MKRNGIIFSIFLLSFIIWRYSHNDVPANDNIELQINLLKDKVHVDEKNWANIKNFNLEVHDLREEGGEKPLFEASLSVIKDLSSCISVNYCGMKKDSEEKAYFDPENTFAHKIAARSLKIMAHLAKKNPALLAEIEGGFWDHVLAFNSRQVTALALELTSTDSHIFNTEFQRIMNQSVGELRILLLRKIESNEKLLDYAIDKTFSEADPYTLIDVLSKIDKIKNSHEVFSRYEHLLCRIKTDELEHNWLAVKKLASKINPQFEAICP